MALFTVDEDLCKKDGSCVRVCPVKIVVQKEKGALPEPSDDAEELCIECGHCVAVCPTAALSHRAMDPADCEEIEKDRRIAPEEAEQFLKSRRSIRLYKDGKLSEELIEKLIDTARYAPSGHNSQPVHWTVVYDLEDLKKLGEYVVEWMKGKLETDPENAKAVNMDRVVAGWVFGIDAIFRGAPHLIITHAPADNMMAPAACTIAITYLELAAHAHGVGSCWGGFFTRAAIEHDPLKKELALPEGHMVFGALMVGKPAVRYKRVPLREPARTTWR